MTSGNPEDAADLKREQRQRRIRIIVGPFMMMFGVPPLVNALGNPRIQQLHGTDILGLFVSAFAIGVGFGLLLTSLVRRGR
jgi:hypothetical protein